MKLTGKRAQRYINLYEKSTDWRLEHVYKTFSWEKRRAFQECVNYATANDAILICGLYWKIISHNQMQFTFAFVNKEGLNVITKDHYYIIDYLPF